MVRLVHTSERFVVMHFDRNGSINTSRPLDLVNSIRQSQSLSSSVTFVAVRMNTFWHLIYKRQPYHR